MGVYTNPIMEKKEASVVMYVVLNKSLLQALFCLSIVFFIKALFFDP